MEGLKWWHTQSRLFFRLLVSRRDQKGMIEGQKCRNVGSPPSVIFTAGTTETAALTQLDIVTPKQPSKNSQIAEHGQSQIGLLSLLCYGLSPNHCPCDGTSVVSRPFVYCVTWSC